MALALVAIVVGVTYYLMDLEKEKEKAEMRAELESVEINFSQEGEEAAAAAAEVIEDVAVNALRRNDNDGEGRLSVKSGRRVSSEKFDLKLVTTTVKTTTVATSTVLSAKKQQLLSMDRSVNQ